MTWWRLTWSRRGGDWRDHGMVRSAWAQWILMGLFDFLLLIFVFWVWMGWILDSYGLVFWILMGFGLVGWIGVVGSGLFGCFCYGFAWFLVGFVFVFLFFFSLFFLGFWFWWAVVVWWAWWWHSGA